GPLRWADWESGLERRSGCDTFSPSAPASTDPVPLSVALMATLATPLTSTLAAEATSVANSTACSGEEAARNRRRPRPNPVDTAHPVVCHAAPAASLASEAS